MPYRIFGAGRDEIHVELEGKPFLFRHNLYERPYDEVVMFFAPHEQVIIRLINDTWKIETKGIPSHEMYYEHVVLHGGEESDILIVNKEDICFTVGVYERGKWRELIEE